jgi:hypothetical protein
VEVHDDDAVASLFALVIMDLCRRLRPHRSRPVCLRCFRSAYGAIVIGSTTSGADGNVSRFLLPGAYTP